MEELKNTTVIFDGREYYFDLERVCEFVFGAEDKTEKEKEIINNYDLTDGDGEGLRLSSKVVREFSAPTEKQFETIRYDLIKTLIIQLITFSDKINSAEVEVAIPVINVDFMPLGTRIVFNTLVQEGILIKKENKN